MAGLTKRQHDAYTWIVKFIKKNGWSPSTAQVADALGIAPTSAQELIKNIVDRGYLVKTKNKHCSLAMPGDE